jgi:hypothetical protein
MISSRRRLALLRISALAAATLAEAVEKTDLFTAGEGGHAHRPSVCATIYSDDCGGTWHAGAIVARDPDPLPNPSEKAVVEAVPAPVK